MTRINSRKVAADGYTFDSRTEYRRYQELRLLEAAGEITGLRVHPKFQLLPEIRTRSGERLARVEYTADFAYEENGRQVVEDVKPHKLNRRGERVPYLTAEFRLRRKIFLHRYPEIEMRITEA